MIGAINLHFAFREYRVQITSQIPAILTGRRFPSVTPGKSGTSPPLMPQSLPFSFSLDATKPTPLRASLHKPQASKQEQIM